MLWYFDSLVGFQISRCLRLTLFTHERAETAKINLITLFYAVNYAAHRILENGMDIILIQACSLRYRVYYISFSHNLLFKIWDLVCMQEHQLVQACR